METLISSSADLVATMQRLYGTADYTQARAQRATFWSYIPYVAAGASNLQFFGSAIGQAGISLQETNMPKASSFGQNHFLLREIHCDWFIPSYQPTAFLGTDATSLVSDFMLGVFNAGVFTFSIGATKYVQQTKPFLFQGPADGRPKIINAGVTSITLTEATPNTLLNNTVAYPYADLVARRRNKFTEDPMLFIEAEQNFSCSIDFPSGVLPVIASSVQNDSTNKLYVGVRLDGVVFQPIS